MRSSPPNKKTDFLKVCFRTALLKAEPCVLSIENPLICSRKEWKEEIGVSDGLRISSDPASTQEDQSLTDADRGETRQNLREPATKRNQDSDEEQGS
jgi:hypothetical protein